MIVKNLADKMLKEGKLKQDEYNLIESKGWMGKEITKEAAMPKLNLSSIKNLSDQAGKAGGFVFPLIAAMAVGDIIKEVVVDPISQSMKTKSSFKQMKDKVPSLEGIDDKTLNDYFGVIKTFAPKAATNPLVAGALVNKMHQFGGVDHKLVQDLSNIQSSVSKDSTVGTAVGSLVKNLATPPTSDYDAEAGRIWREGSKSRKDWENVASEIKGKSNNTSEASEAWKGME